MCVCVCVCACVPGRTVQLARVCDKHARDDVRLLSLMCTHVMSTSGKGVAGHDGCIGAVYDHICK